MYRRDYVLRVIEQFSRALAVLLKKITGRQLSSAEARAQITEIASQSGLDLDVARSLDSTTLLMWLAPRGDIDAGKFWLMAELLFLAGMQAREEDLADLARTDLQRARLILSRLAVDWRPQAEGVSGSMPSPPSPGQGPHEVRAAWTQLPPSPRRDVNQARWGTWWAHPASTPMDVASITRGHQVEG